MRRAIENGFVDVARCGQIAHALKVRNLELRKLVLRHFGGGPE
jgi:hypothetical protein